MGSQFAIVSKYPLSSAETETTVQVLVFSAPAWDDATLWNWVEPGIHQSKRMAWDMKSITYSVIVVTRQIRPKHLVSDSAMPSWWFHQMEAFSALLALCEGNLPVTGKFPSQRPVTRSFDVFFGLRLNKRLMKTIEREKIWDAIVPIMTSL